MTQITNNDKKIKFGPYHYKRELIYKLLIEGEHKS